MAISSCKQVTHSQPTGLEQPAKNSSSEMGSFMYDLMMLAFNPFGGSLVILTPFCRTEMGKWGEG